MDKVTFIRDLRRDKLIRILCFPFENIYRRILYNRFQKSEDSRYIKSLKDSHLGERCFIIGNGPSLTPSDLDQLENEFTFAANRIYHIFSKTVWRPSIYLCVDNDGLSSEYKRIVSSGNFPKFINFKAKRLGRSQKDNLWYLYIKGNFSINPDMLSTELSEDISVYSAQMKTVTATAIEMAIYMGFKSLYLIGIDNNYAKIIDANGKMNINTELKSSYFAGMRDANGKLGDGHSIANIESMTQSYVVCKKFAEKKGVKIYNATRGGKLEVFERVDFDSLFSKEKKELSPLGGN